MKLDLDRYVPGLLLWLSNKIASNASILYRERFGISVAEWRVLSFFKIYPWSTASQACDLMGLDKGGVSRSVSILEMNGWIDSRPQGLRKVEYRLTPSGNKLHNEIYKTAMEREQSLLFGISEEERDILISLLRRMLVNVDNSKFLRQEED
jgi:DNA-binding MarR family transcriptional regulator